MSQNSVTALYRKYRPQSFDEVYHQAHITEVLKAAIQKKSIPHALLFTGPRGTGKTTVARIFAQGIGATEVDIYEIDAASNRGIDDIRALKESVQTVPFSSPYKVYIIDEVHMLSKDAFNALLKTLEEPPAHVVFILATTEKEKVLDTIISRCVVFDFRAPEQVEIEELLRDVFTKEGYTTEGEVCALIARAAQGSYRDALSVAQKVLLASTDTRIQYDEIRLLLGAPTHEHVYKVLSALATKTAEDGLRAIREAYREGTSMALFGSLLLDRIRTIILLRFEKERSKEHLERYTPHEHELLLAYTKDAVQTINAQLLTKALQSTSLIDRSSIPTLPLELLLIEHCT